MQLPEEPTLLQSVMVHAPLSEDLERAWAFLLFCGVLESKGHDDFVRLATEKQGEPLALADELLDLATRRAETMDPRGDLATRLWQYFEVGQSLQPELDEGTQPGLQSPIASEG